MAIQYISCHGQNQVILIERGLDGDVRVEFLHLPIQTGICHNLACISRLMEIETFRPRVEIGEVKNDGDEIAKARDVFFANHPELLKCAADGKYLKNRLGVAFISGWNAGRKK